MCIRIIGAQELELSMSRPLKEQIVGAVEIVVSYDPQDPKIPYFVNQLEQIVKSGFSCTAEIKVNANNNINGIKLERKIEKLKEALDTNEAIKLLTKFHADTDRKLSEISNICLGEFDER